MSTGQLQWALESSAEDAYADELAESLAAGFTVQDILAYEGLATEDELRALYMMIWDSIDKNDDGATCVADFYCVEKISLGVQHHRQRLAALNAVILWGPALLFFSPSAIPLTAWSAKVPRACP